MKSNRYCRGSVQIVEVSFVFPLVMAVILAIFYFIFVVFLRVHIYNIAFDTANRIDDIAATGSDYWVVNGEYIDDKLLEEVEKDFCRSLDNCHILPGITFKNSIDIITSGALATVNVNVDVKLSNYSCFKVRVEENICRPTEKMRLLEFERKTGCNLERLGEIYDSIF